MGLEELESQIDEHIAEIVRLNNIKHPEYDSYINGWEDCEEFILSIIDKIKEIT